MKILVYPHDLGIGGSQLNAIEIGHEVSLLGHEVIVYGSPGPLTSRIAQLGLEFVESPDPGRRPTPEVVRDLAGLIDTRGIDIAHGYEWPPGLECYLACKGHRKARAVTTVMSMAVAPFLPHSIPVVVGTQQIAEVERAGGRRLVSVIEPPVDIEANRPGAAPGLGAFREQWDLDDLPTIVCVTRLARQLKLEGLLTAIDAVEALHVDVATRLVIVGDGEARPEVEERANQVNRTLGYHAVVLTGELADPRPAYELADVCIGMGGSALRSMAFAKPLIVQGEGGFFRLLTPETLPTFLWTGWYGHGNEGGNPVRDLQHILFELLEDQQRSRHLGQFGRATIEQRFSLASAAERQLDIDESVLQRHPRASRTALADIASSAQFVRYHADKRRKRILGLRASDDFNAAPVAKDGPAQPAPMDVEAVEAPVAGDVVVYFAGVSWDAVAGTDSNLARALARHQHVIWVDPPMSWTARRRRGIDVPPLSTVGPHITRVNTSCPPGVSRPVLRRVARLLTSRRARSAIRRLGMPVSAIVVSSPEQRMPRWKRNAAKVYFETDDFVAGAELLGITSRYATSCRRLNVRRSDVVVGITESLTSDLADGKPAATLPNGTDHSHFRYVDTVAAAPDVHLERPIAGVVGQLNDRLDLGMLEAVADLHVSLLLLGPRYDVSADTRSRLDALIRRPNVQWIDRQPFDRLPAYLATIDVGLTPYALTAFNRSSFPLKTLEYLAAGRPVVSTDLPSARALDTDLVTLASGPAEFAKATAHLLDQPIDGGMVARRRDFAESHSWEARAVRLNEIINAAITDKGRKSKR